MTQLRRILCFAVFGAALLFLPGKAADAALGQQESPLTNADVISMVKSGLPEAVIIGSIKTSENNFDTSAKALIALQKASVPQKVMQAMIDAAAAKKNATAAAAPVAGAALTPPAQSTTSLGASTAMPAGGVANPSPLPSGAPTTLGGVVFMLLTGNSKQPLAAEKLQVAPTQAKESTL